MTRLDEQLERDWQQQVVVTAKGKKALRHWTIPYGWWLDSISYHLRRLFRRGNR